MKHDMQTGGGAARRLLAFGGGVDSTAILAAYLDPAGAAKASGTPETKLRQVLHSSPLSGVVFADPGAEFKATYRNVRTAARLCLRHGLTFTTVYKRTADGRRLRIQDWLLRNGTIPVMPGGHHVCSLKFKGQQLQQWAGRAFAGDSIEWLIGIEAEEQHRQKRFQPDPAARHQAIYPLVLLGWDRRTCERVIEACWPHTVRKSSCVFCPFMSEPEILALFRDDPEAGDLARQIETRFSETSPIKHQVWIDGGRQLDAAGRAPRGQWKKDSWAAGARLFTATVDGRRLTTAEWQRRAA